MTSHYNTKGDINLKEEEITAGKDKGNWNVQGCRGIPLCQP